MAHHPVFKISDVPHAMAHPAWHAVQVVDCLKVLVVVAGTAPAIKIDRTIRTVASPVTKMDCNEYSPLAVETLYATRDRSKRTTWSKLTSPTTRVLESQRKIELPGVSHPVTNPIWIRLHRKTDTRICTGTSNRNRVPRATPIH